MRSAQEDRKKRGNITAYHHEDVDETMVELTESVDNSFDSFTVRSWYKQSTKSTQVETSR